MPPLSTAKSRLRQSADMSCIERHVTKPPIPRYLLHGLPIHVRWHVEQHQTADGRIASRAPTGSPSARFAAGFGYGMTVKSPGLSWIYSKPNPSRMPQRGAFCARKAGNTCHLVTQRARSALDDGRSPARVAGSGWERDLSGPFWRRRGDRHTGGVQ